MTPPTPSDSTPASTSRARQPKPSNFGFVGAVFPALLMDCRHVEEAAVSNPRAAAVQTRFVAEQVVRHIAAFFGGTAPSGTNHTDARRSSAPDQGTFSDLTRTPQFRRNVPDIIQSKVHAIRKIGNLAAHNPKYLAPEVAINAVAHLYDLLAWAAANVAGQGKKALPAAPFDKSILLDAPKHNTAGTTATTVTDAQRNAELKKLTAELEARDNAAKESALLLSKERAQCLLERQSHLREQEKFRKARAEALEGQARIDELQAANEELKRQLEQALENARQELLAAQSNAGQVDTSASYAISEAQTRRDIIDPMLAEAGFTPAAGNVRYEVPLPSGRADYVLYGSDGKALAVVEAKKPAIEASAACEQARHYADDLEKQYGQRPLIYYANGHVVKLWDDAANLPGGHGYPPRSVEGYATADELYRIIHNRTLRAPLSDTDIDQAIAGRNYQQKAIRAVTEHFEAGHRHALLVMATGTGKTRTTIALTKMLQQARWAKNVLFLADRKALVNQAAKNFQELYGEAGVVNLLDNPDGIGSVYVCTYQTIITRLGIDCSPYAFDLIIVDEAHRSIYRRYKRIFEYFDALLFGLTATPRSEVDHNTYSLFHLEDGKPTGEYSLAEAVADNYLVPFRPFAGETLILRRGIHFDELSDEEQLQLDLLDWGTDDDGNPIEAPEGASADEINTKLFNHSTIELVLRQVLENGIKVEGADRLGKTIIFARNRKHAELIHDHLVDINPVLNCAVITHDNRRAQTLIDNFGSTKPGSIDVAISVDMLDTGIDVPAVVNLVFFKPVYSKTKFWQMMGRGTRLCENLFGPGQHKTEFFVFDYCGNLDYFTSEIAYTETEGSRQKSLSERLFTQRLRMLDSLADGPLTEDTKSLLRRQLSDVPDASALVRPSDRSALAKYRREASWENLSSADLAEMEQRLAHLPFQTAGENEFAKRFDLLIINMQVALAEGRQISDNKRERVQHIANNLLTKLNVPAIAQQAERLELAVDPEWWEGITPDDLELLRHGVRGLVQYVDKGKRNQVVIDVADELGELRMVDVPLEGASTTVTGSSVEDKIREVIEAHGDALVLQKIRRAKTLSPVDIAALEELVASAGIADLAGLRDQLGMSLPRFVRGLVGLEEAAAREAFADFLDGTKLNSVQLDFMNRLIRGLVLNGVVTMSELFDSPYADHGTPFDVFDDNIATVTDIKDRLDRIARSAELMEMEHTDGRTSPSIGP